MIRLAFMVGLVTWGAVCSVAAAASDDPRQFHLLPGESRVWFDADARLHSFRGETQQLTGRFTLQRRSPPQLADAVVTIGAASLTTGHPERDADMRRDFLEVDRFPTIEFRVDQLLTPQAAAAGWDLGPGAARKAHGAWGHPRGQGADDHQYCRRARHRSGTNPPGHAGIQHSRAAVVAHPHEERGARRL